MNVYVVTNDYFDNDGVHGHWVDRVFTTLESAIKYVEDKGFVKSEGSAIGGDAWMSYWKKVDDGHEEYEMVYIREHELCD